jgi:hypothetical protein
MSALRPRSRVAERRMTMDNIKAWMKDMRRADLAMRAVVELQPLFEHRRKLALIAENLAMETKVAITKAGDLAAASRAALETLPKTATERTAAEELAKADSDAADAAVVAHDEAQAAYVAALRSSNIAESALHLAAVFADPALVAHEQEIQGLEADLLGL